MMISTFKFWVLPFLFLIMTTFAAGQCIAPTICQAYSMADSVFLGKVSKIENAMNEYGGGKKVTFSVDRMFKGTLEPSVEAAFYQQREDFEFLRGEKYLVYKYSDDLSERICNRTELIKDSQEDIEYATNLISQSQKYSIEGQIISSSKDLDAKVFIFHKSHRDVLPIDKNGFFRYQTKVPGNYKVKIMFPAEVNIFIDSLGLKKSNVGENYEYEVNLNDPGCNYHEFYVSALK